MEKISPALLNLLLNASWQIALIAAAAEVSTRFLRSSARERHRVWVAALLLSLALPLFQVARPLPLRFTHRPDAATSVPNAWMSPAFDIQYEPAADSPGRSAPAKQTYALPSRVATSLVVLYLAIVLIRVIALARAWWSTRRLLKSAREIEVAGALERVVTHCLAATDLARARLLVSDAIASPITLGFAPAVILVPESLLREREEALLTSAIGHELVHIDRRDYLLNLVYRVMSVPLSFHPAAWFIQRRIEQTRELRCDEVVTERLLSPTAYARSLVELAGQAVRPAATVAVGIADADILEERIMFMLKKPKLSSPKRVLLLTSAALVFTAPCIAAAPYALHVEVQPHTQSAATLPITVGNATDTATYAPTAIVQPAQEQHPEQQEKKRSADFEAGVVAGKMYAARGFAYTQDGPAKSKEEQERAVTRKRAEAEMSPEEREANMIRIREELAVRSKYLAELSKAAKVTMQQAIEVATREVPGKVFESSLVGQRRMMVKQPDGTIAENSIGSGNPQYRIVILAGDENSPERHILFIDAVTGSVVRSEVE